MSKVLYYSIYAMRNEYNIYLVGCEVSRSGNNHEQCQRNVFLTFLASHVVLLLLTYCCAANITSSTILHMYYTYHPGHYRAAILFLFLLFLMDLLVEVVRYFGWSFGHKHDKWNRLAKSISHLYDITQLPQDSAVY